MAAKLFGGVITMTGSRLNVATALGLTPAEGDTSTGQTSNFTLQAPAANAAPIYIGDSTLTGSTNAFVELVAGASLAEILNTKWMNLSNIYVIGTAADKVRVCAVQ